jgi:hypothetical protein
MGLRKWRMQAWQHRIDLDHTTILTANRLRRRVVSHRKRTRAQGVPQGGLWHNCTAHLMLLPAEKSPF